MIKEPRTLEDKLTFFVDMFQLPTVEELKAFDMYMLNTVSLPLAKRLNKSEFITMFRFTNAQNDDDVLCKDCTLKTSKEVWILAKRRRIKRSDKVRHHARGQYLKSDRKRSFTSFWNDMFADLFSSVLFKEQRKKDTYIDTL